MKECRKQEEIKKGEREGKDELNTKDTTKKHTVIVDNK